MAKSTILRLFVTTLPLLSLASAAVLPASSNTILISSSLSNKGSATSTYSSSSSSNSAHTTDAPGYTSIDPNITVKTVTKSDETVQINSPSPPSSTPNPRVLGYYNTIVDTNANPSVDPFPTANPSAIGSVDTSLSKTADLKSYSTPITISPSFTPLAKRSVRVPSAVGNSGHYKVFVRDILESEKEKSSEAEAEDANKLYRRVSSAAPATGTNIFTPIATSAPIALFSRKTTHPVPRTSITDTNKALHTNKFYANFFLAGQSSPIFTLPYQLWFNQTNPTWGLNINHAPTSLRNFGPATGPNGAVEYYINPIYIKSLSLSATEFTNATSTMELKNLGSQSIDAYFYANKAKNGAGTGYMYTPLCLGMGFVSAVYQGLTPVFTSAVFFRALALTTVSTSTTLTKYTITLEDNTLWLLYAFNSQGTPSLLLTIVDNGKIQSAAPFHGVIQIAKLSSTTAGDSVAEKIFDATAGMYCKGTAVTGSVTGSTGSYSLTFTKSGPGNSELLMYALPHHISSFDSTTTAKAQSSMQLSSTTKGMMTAVVADSWSMVEPDLPVNIGYLPVPTGSSTATFSTTALQLMSKVATSEIAQDINAQTNLDSVYFSGKAMAKFAYICLTASEILKDKTLATTCLNKLKTAFDRFATNQQTYALVYDTTWRGIISNASYVTGDPNSDFGSGYYNDHHFHYSYFVQAAAIVGMLDNKLSTTPTWVTKNQAWVSTLIRDVSNPSPLDTYFPVSRSFDFYHGHSWAKGLFDSLDGKDEESTSEDVNFAYAMKLWGNLVSDSAMEARGNLMLGILRNSLNKYFLLSSTNTNQPSNFIGNKVTGILFENKVHHMTYFGTTPQQIQGIHMLPLTPISPYIRNAAFCTEEWNTWFSGKTGNIVDGWKGILYANVAIFNPSAAWKFFNQTGFNSSWLDGGASRTWYLAFAGGLGGASS